MERLGTLAAVLVVASCSAGNGDGRSPPLAPGFDGTWVDCSNDGGNDMRDVFVIAGGNASVVSYTYATADRSCGGAATPQGQGMSGPFTLGTAADAWLDARAWRRAAPRPIACP